MSVQLNRAAAALAVVLAVAALAAPAAAEVECLRPEAPEVPDGSTATEDELADAGAAVRAFVDDSQEYLACIEDKEAAYGADITPTQKALVDAVYNAGVESIQAVAAAYNEAVRTFNAREE